MHKKRKQSKLTISLSGVEGSLIEHLLPLMRFFDTLQFAQKNDSHYNR